MCYKLEQFYPWYMYYILIVPSCFCIYLIWVDCWSHYKKSHDLAPYMSFNTEVSIINWFVVCNKVGEAQESSFVAQNFALITSVPQLLKKSSSKPLLNNYLLISSIPITRIQTLNSKCLNMEHTYFYSITKMTFICNCNAQDVK